MDSHKKKSTKLSLPFCCSDTRPKADRIASPRVEYYSGTNGSLIHQEQHNFKMNEIENHKTPTKVDRESAKTREKTSGKKDIDKNLDNIIQKKDNEISALHQNMIAQQQQISSLTSEIHNFRETLSRQLEEERSKYDRDIGKLADYNYQLNLQISTLLKKTEESQSKHTQAIKDLGQIKIDGFSQHKNLDFSQIQHKLGNIDDQINSMRQNLKARDLQNESLKHNLESLQQANLSLRSNQEHLQQAVHSKELELRSVLPRLSEIEKIRGENESLNHKLESLQQANLFLRNNQEHLQQALHSKELELTKTLSKLSELEKSKEEYEKVYQEKLHLFKALEGQSAEVSRKNQEILAIKMEKEKLEEELILKKSATPSSQRHHNNKPENINLLALLSDFKNNCQNVTQNDLIKIILQLEENYSNNLEELWAKTQEVEQLRTKISTSENKSFYPDAAYQFNFNSFSASKSTNNEEELNNLKNELNLLKHNYTKIDQAHHIALVEIGIKNDQIEDLKKLIIEYENQLAGLNQDRSTFQLQQEGLPHASSSPFLESSQIIKLTHENNKLMSELQHLTAIKESNEIELEELQRLIEEMHRYFENFELSKNTNNNFVSSFKSLEINPGYIPESSKNPEHYKEESRKLKEEILKRTSELSQRKLQTPKSGFY